MKKYVYVAAALAYACFIFYLSSQSNPPNPIKVGMLIRFYLTLKNLGLEFLAYPFYFAVKNPDKFYHTLLYMGFGFALYPAVRSTINRYPPLMSIAIGTLYGISDEIHQMFVPYRTASMSDLMADVLGLTISQIVILIMMIIKRRIT